MNDGIADNNREHNMRSCGLRTSAQLPGSRAYATVRREVVRNARIAARCYVFGACEESSLCSWIGPDSSRGVSRGPHFEEDIHVLSRLLIPAGVADLWGLFDFVRLFGDLAWIYVGIPRKRGVEIRAFPGLRIQTWDTHSWCLIEMRGTRPPPRRSIAPIDWSWVCRCPQRLSCLHEDLRCPLPARNGVRQCPVHPFRRR
jgi:hypothetical protein